MGSPPGHARGVSLWLVPEGTVRERLAQIIAELSRRCGTPALEPHVTLLGGIALPEREVLARSQVLAPRLSALSISLTTIDGCEEYFRCLFMHVEETKALLAAHARVRETLGGVAGPRFEPHLSLLYGHLPPAEKRAALSDLGGRSWGTFEAGQLHVVRTEGAPARWRTLATLTLG